MDNNFTRMIQIGMVTDRDISAYKVRVKFKDTGLTSDWLCVLRSPSEVKVQTEHGATVMVTPWMPKVNDTVLVAYLPIFNSDGFVIGGI